MRRRRKKHFPAHVGPGRRISSLETSLCDLQSTLQGSQHGVFFSHHQTCSLSSKTVVEGVILDSFTVMPPPTSYAKEVEDGALDLSTHALTELPVKANKVCNVRGG